MLDPNDPRMKLALELTEEAVTAQSEANGEAFGLIPDPCGHATTLADLIAEASDGCEVGTVRAHREQWAIVIAALRAFAVSESAAQSDQRDAARYRRLRNQDERFWVRVKHEDGLECDLFGQDLDFFIDAAMRSSASEGKE